MKSNYKNIFWGSILVIMGIMFFLDQLNLIDFEWYMVWQLWPLILILLGINLIPMNDYLKLVISIVFIIIAFILVFKYGEHPFFHYHINHINHNTI